MTGKALSEIMRDISIADLLSTTDRQRREIWHLRAMMVQLECRLSKQTAIIRHYENVVMRN